MRSDRRTPHDPHTLASAQFPHAHKLVRGYYREGVIRTVRCVKGSLKDLKGVISQDEESIPSYRYTCESPYCNCIKLTIAGNKR